MWTLAIDTTGEYGSVALLDAEKVVEEVLLHAPAGFSGILFESMAGLLGRHGVRLAEIGLFAGASGPGAFTGVRIGLAAIKGLGEVLGKPVVAVSNLEALAEFGHGDLRAAVIDARRGEVFAALFDRDGAAVVPESVLPFARFVEGLGEREFEWISSGLEPFLAGLEGTRVSALPVTRAPLAVAGAIGRIALRRWRAGESGDAAGIEANYVRRSDAELLFKG